MSQRAGPSLWTIATRSVTLWVGILFSVIGLVFATIGVKTALEERAYETEGVVVDAFVQDKSILRANRQNTPRTQYLLAYHFTASDGQEVTGSADVPVEEWERLEAGDTFSVTYLPGQADSSRPAGGNEWIAALVFGLIGGIFTLVGGGLAFADLRGLVRAARVLRHGLVTEGTVVRTEATGTRINRISQYQIRYRYQDHVGRTHESVSHLIPPGEAAGYKEHDRGTVRFDREQPEISLWMGKS